MGKIRNCPEYHCSNCGAVEPKLAEQCPSCGEWNTFEERTRAPRGRAQASTAPAGVVRLYGPSRPVARTVMGVNEFDRIAGGSLVSGSVMLLGSDPVVGKATVLLQVLAALDADGIGGLYVSGKESIEQVRLRARQRDRGAAGVSMAASTDASTVADTLQSTMVIVFFAILEYSRRTHVQGIPARAPERLVRRPGAPFRYFGGVPQEVLSDNAWALVTHHDAASREIMFNGRLHAFARHWAVRPQACAPYQARTKGKDERGVGSVKANALAGHRFVSWPSFEAQLAWWMREIADVRTHGTTCKAPLDRFERAEAAALRPLDDRPSFQRVRELVRTVQNDCCVEVDENAYSVPWRLIGERVRVLVAGGRVTVEHGHRTVASHSQHSGRRHRSIDPSHLDGIVGAPRTTPAPIVAEPPLPEIPEGKLLRPLAEYEALVGGGW